MSEMETAQELVTITVDGKSIQAPKGAMLIEVTDRERINVPRFCYHSKLSVAANCRMCLVEVEKAPKPMPACATPIMDGMVVHTKSANALNAQKSVMEFLLINHPLDCPICDQGGECELQDVAMGYGNEVSQFTEGKRVVFDKNIGPLISTELTRCIHCTRCVRFGEEIAGIRELGMTGRGEKSRIGTYIERAVESELSGNVIDLCPVGALTAKPSRFTARAWEMAQHASVAAHDCIGSNIYVHTLRGELHRVVPRDNEAINEVWISDRDRFSYEGVNSADRLSHPQLKKEGHWESVSWEEALQHICSNLSALDLQRDIEPVEEAEKETGEDEQQEKKLSKLAALVSPSSTLEELYLSQKLLRGLGSGNIDHRLRQTDFNDEESAPIMPWLGQNLADLETNDCLLIIGSNVRKEQPIANHRIRKATLENDASVHFINPREYDLNYEVASYTSVAQQLMPNELAGIAKTALKISGNKAPSHLKNILSGVKPKVGHTQIAEQLSEGSVSSIILGSQAMMHPDFTVLRALAHLIATETGSRFGYLSDSCNTAGAWLAGAIPHRGPAGERETVEGESLDALIESPADTTLLLNVEPDLDLAQGREMIESLTSNNFVVAISAYDSDALREVADILLPAATFTETSGTFVNVEGHWQSFVGAKQPVGEARPAWKILRVLGSMMHIDGFDYMSSEQVRDELRSMCESIELDNSVPVSDALTLSEDISGLRRCADVPIYATDAIVRRAKALQSTSDAVAFEVNINSKEAERLGVIGLDSVNVKQGAYSAQLNLVIDDGIPDGIAWLPLGVHGSELLGHPFGEITIEKAQS